MDPPLHLACTADAAFVPHCAAMLHSVCTQHAPARVHVHFLHDDDLSADLLKQLGGFVTHLGAHWEPCRVDEARRNLLPDHARYGRGAWYRIFLPQLLPQLDRILYLDADMIIADRLDELWTTELDGYAVAAVSNPLYPEMSTAFLQDLGVPSVCCYFNSGMLLLNLQDWRQQRHTEAVLAFIRAGVALDSWPDQNALNAVLWQRCKLLPPRWNTLSIFFELEPARLCYSATEITQARRAPAIIHFIGHYKPWHYRSKHPFRQLYFKHLEQTPWRGLPLEGRTWRHRFMRLLPWLFALRLEARVQRVWRRLQVRASRWPP